MTDKTHVSAPVAGKVLDIRVSEGENVSKGQVLVVFEAMRMENELVSSRDGEIDRIYVEDGDIVDTGTILLDYRKRALS